MERLTKNDIRKVCYDPWELCGMDKYCNKGTHEEGGCAKGCHIVKMYIKLAEYEDEEENGLLYGKWIPCSERLPDDRKEKLVYLSTGRMTIAKYNKHRLPNSVFHIGWGYPIHSGYIDFEKETVIAWQPLPDPYKAEKTKQESQGWKEQIMQRFEKIN